MTKDIATYVYCPASQRVDEAQSRDLLEACGAALWITGGDGAPSATLLPTMWRGDLLIAHASDHNEQFSLIEGEVPCRVVVQGADAYISPRWYQSVQPASEGGSARGRAEGRGVGTWNYRQVQIAGVLSVHRDRERLRREVSELGALHDELRLGEGCPADAHRGPWTAAELPGDYFDAMLRGIVGLELRITEVVGRFKLSQNRTEVDREGAITGLGERGRPRDLAVAEAMRTATPLYDPTTD